MLLQLVSILDFFLLQSLKVLNSAEKVLFIRLILVACKFVARLITGKSTLHRLCADKRTWMKRKGRMTLLLAQHLKLSRSLQSECKVIFKSTLQADFDRLTKIVALRKGIPLESGAFKVLKEAINNIAALERLIAFVITRANTPFKRTEADLKLLNSLWQALNPESEKAPSLPADEWKELGFQGNDPSTDFRGMGMLGLDQLLAFATAAPKSAHNILQQSKYGTAWYSFAPVGINITALLYGLLVSHSADEYFYRDGPTRDTFDAVYGRLFEVFNEYWVLEGARDVMDFSRIFGKLRTDIAKNLQGTGQFFN